MSRRAGFDPTDIFAALNKAQVRYLVVGGVAAVLYGVARVTWDVDIAVQLTVPNVDRLAKALGGIGFIPRVPAAPSGLANAKVRDAWIRQKGMKVYSFIERRSPPRNVDVMVRPPHNFQELYQHRAIVKVGGVSIPLMPAKALVQMKRKAGRLQDLQDISDLKRLGLA